MADLHSRQEADLDLRLIAHVVTTMRGRPPAGYWYAPGTIAWVSGVEGSVITATQWGAVVAAQPNDRSVLDVRSINRPSEGSVMPIHDVAGAKNIEILTVVRALMSAGLNIGGMDLLGWTDVPEGVGASTGVALETATAMALRDLCKLDLSDAELVRTIGSEAVAASLTLSDGEALLRTSVRDSTVPFALAENTIRALIIDSRVRERFSPILDADHIVESAQAALEQSDLVSFGETLTAAHAAAAETGATSPQQDAVADACLAAGALGARAVVDADGRPTVALVPITAMPTVRAAVLARFAENDWRAPRFLTASTVRPAHRVA